MKYRFTDLVDIEAFRNMLKSFYEATGILHGLVDADNNVISAIGWQEACTEFHRAFPISNQRCLESNRYLAENVGESGFIGCKCSNGLMDYASPIVIEGEKMATLYFGQVLHEPPDLEFFRRQAQECGFDEEAYLAAIRKVPVIPRERIEPIMDFFSRLAQMLARSGLDRLREREAEQKLAELNRDLARRVEERTTVIAKKNRQLADDIASRRRAEEELRERRAQLQAILDSSPIGIGWSRRGKVEYVNRKFSEVFGYRLEEVPTVKRLYQKVFPQVFFRKGIVKRWTRQVMAAKESGDEPPPLESPLVCKDGRVRYGVLSVSWIDERTLVNFSDITDRWLAQRHDRSRNRILQMIAQGGSLDKTLEALVRSVEEDRPGMLCSILLLDKDGRHLHVGAAPSLPDFYNEAVEGLEIGEGIGSCGTAAFTRQRVVAADIQSHPYWAGIRDLAARAGVASCWSEPVFSSKERVLGTFAIYHRQPATPDDEDLHLIGQAANLASIAIEHHQSLGELERQAHIDYLTGLANRGRFMELAEAEQARAARYRNPFAVLLLDVDHFKSINDRHGHKAGDAVLKALGAILRKTLREVDIIGRIGGEEFAALLPETCAARAPEVAERIRRAIADSEMPGGNGEPLHVTVSIGVVAATEHAGPIDKLLSQADTALYLAKNSGRNRVSVAKAA